MFTSHLQQSLVSHQNPSLLSSVNWTSESLPKLPDFHHILECTSHIWMIPFLSMILVLLLALIHSSLTSLIMSNSTFLSMIFQRSMKKLVFELGNGTTIHNFVDTKEKFDFLLQVPYHLPSSKVCLFSPLVFQKQGGGKSIIFGDQVEIYQTNQNHIDILIAVFESNVTIVQNVMCTTVLPGWKYQLCWTSSFFWCLLGGPTPTKETLDHEFSTYYKPCYPCIGTASNANLSRPQKELLLWHWKIGISIYCIQELMQLIEAHESCCVCHWMPPIITPIFKSSPNLKPPPCQSYQLAHSKCCVPKVSQVTSMKLDKKGAFSRDIWGLFYLHITKAIFI